ncbi:DUF6896 domain-containing protein [Cellulomonas xiejunii]|uniref:DUF6896 domain-containing protein n=1 Tax=Cellulomonas xiejunii TaxID=2968083 RepID=A0ABY5KPP7_9CELL|nr:hypothetical protein [Cellulomonas xiejunii]MCC2321110.1 hypothetical protein [Cellulomonas xiejunii]UUI71703.1 hypothetical protein NP048_18245 [Cellulomonas xiejunii]
MTRSGERSYDERAVTVGVLRLGRQGRAVLSAACCQTLWSTYDAVAPARLEASALVHEHVLDELWAYAAGERGPDGLVDLDPVVDEVTPRDDSDDWSASSAFLQSVGIAILNALHGADTDDPKRAVFAARQLQDVADHVDGLAEDDGPSALALICELVDAYLAAAAACETGAGDGVATLRDTCEHDGERLAALALPHLGDEPTPAPARVPSEEAGDGLVDELVADLRQCADAMDDLVQELRPGGEAAERATLPRSGVLPSVGFYRLHGYGCRVTMRDGREVDFDWDAAGRPSLDLWRSQSYLESRGYAPQDEAALEADLRAQRHLVTDDRSGHLWFRLDARR